MHTTVSGGTTNQNARTEMTAVLTDAEWLRIALVLPCRRQLTGRRRSTTLRAVVEAILWQRHTRRPWRHLPAEYPKWQTVYGYFRRWNRDGTLRRIREVLQTSPMRVHAPAESKNVNFHSQRY